MPTIRQVLPAEPLAPHAVLGASGIDDPELLSGLGAGAAVAGAAGGQATGGAIAAAPSTSFSSLSVCGGRAMT